ncbi:MAG: hypothetical protein MZU84_04495 [Sphingobacterium sp.]|nr:hypothetical protein [Sphingobacterium sp.]
MLKAVAGLAARARLPVASCRPSGSWAAASAAATAASCGCATARARRTSCARA